MTVASGPGSAEYGPGPGRTRQRKIVLIAGFLLMLCWMLGTSSLFRRELDRVGDDGQVEVDFGSGTTSTTAAAATTAATVTAEATATASATPEPAAEEPFPDNVAVIMETDPAKVSNLVPIMLHFMAVLGPRWPVVLLTDEANWSEPDSPALRRALADGRIRTMFLPNGTAFPDHHSVSLFYTGPWLWEQFEAAHRVLLFQADSILCSRSPLSIDDFLQWDLVGAPIAAGHGHGYNGGLSLRNPRAMLAVARDPRLSFARDSGGGEAEVPNEMKFEDQWFYARLRERGDAALPGVDVARTFAVETVWYARPLGYHQPARWQKARMRQIAEWCPEVGMLPKNGHFY